MTAETPIQCHRSFAAHPHVKDRIVLPCIGSRCAMWVPATAEWDGVNAESYTIQGHCADNYHRAPWPDPAKETP